MPYVSHSVVVLLEINSFLLLFVECSSPFGGQNTEWNDFLDVYKLIERLRKKQHSKFDLNQIVSLSFLVGVGRGSGHHPNPLQDAP